MAGEPGPGQPRFLTGVGLCSGCRHARTVTSGKGSTFWLCERSRSDPAYQRYPPLPVIRCPGFEPEPMA